MRLILSRKGFDSSAGGCPSPIFPDGSMLSLPIPDKHAQTRYEEIRWQRDVGELVERLAKRDRTHFAHLDPDLRAEALPREPGWRPMLGQHSAAQSHLRNQGVGVGDLFLFWGLFRRVDEQLRWVGEPMHAIWGWLQVGEVVSVDSGLPGKWPWARKHPHLSPGFAANGNNTLYIAAKSLSLNGAVTELPGSGVFERFAESRVLTNEGGEALTSWSLPRWFKPNGRRPLSYHDDESRWTDDGDRVSLRAASRGQEFVLDLAEYPEGESWIARLLSSEGPFTQNVGEDPEMGMTQMQIIQSLGDATNWLERELGRGVDPAELRHLTGRIGELYAAVVTNGQLASEVNQKGYDVVSSENERISVKTTTMTSGTGHVAFNGNTLDHVDRVMVLRVNVEEMQIDTLFDGSVEEAKSMMSNGNIALSKFGSKKRKQLSTNEVAVVTEVAHGDYLIRELETGSIEVLRNGDRIEVVRPVLLEICRGLGLSPLNGNGNPMNTRQLGYLIVRTLPRNEMHPTASRI